MMQNTSSAVMQQRTEPHDSLDDFPTQPWATRALLEHVIIPQRGMNGRNEIANMSVWEPACNRGHMAKPLKEYFRRVYTSDIFDYSEHSGSWCQDRVIDFLWPESESPVMAARGVDWVITNPPFRLAEQFIERASRVPKWQGTAVFVRSAFIEGIGRWERLFSVNPPTIYAQFAERVPLFKGRIDPNGASATAYCWLVWMANRSPQPMMWIPPCRKQLERAEDYA